MNRSIGSIEQVGDHFIVRSNDCIQPVDTPFHGGKKIVNDFEELVDFLGGFFQIKDDTDQLPLKGVEEGKVHRLEIGNV